MATPYQRGAAFEHRVKSEMEKAGWLVTRSPGSKSPFDLMAIRSGGMVPVVWLVQCKLHGQIGNKERDDLQQVALRVHAWPVLARMLPGTTSGLIHYQDMLGRREIEP